MTLTVQQPRRKPLPAWAFAMLIVVAPSIIFLVAASLGLTKWKPNRFKQPTEADRAAVVTAAELVSYFQSTEQVEAKREEMRKSEEPDGSLKLAYRYPAQSVPADPITVECFVVRGPDAAGAKQQMEEVIAEMKKNFVAKEGGFAWGDASVSGDAKRDTDGAVIGSVFVARKGRHLFLLRVTGFKLETAEQQRDVLLPKLERLETYGTDPNQPNAP